MLAQHLRSRAASRPTTTSSARATQDPSNSGQGGIALKHTVEDWAHRVRRFTPPSSTRARASTARSSRCAPARPVRAGRPRRPQSEVLHRVSGGHPHLRRSRSTAKFRGGAVFGEFTYRPNQPLQYNSQDLIAGVHVARRRRHRCARRRTRPRRARCSTAGSATTRCSCSSARLGPVPGVLGAAGLNLGARDRLQGRARIFRIPSVVRFGRSDVFGQGPVNGVCPPPAAPVSCTFDGYVSQQRVRLPTARGPALSQRDGWRRPDPLGLLRPRRVGLVGRRRASSKAACSRSLPLQANFAQGWTAAIAWQPTWGGTYNNLRDRSTAQAYRRLPILTVAHDATDHPNQRALHMTRKPATPRPSSPVLVQPRASRRSPPARSAEIIPPDKLAADAAKAVAAGKDPIPGPRTCFWSRGPASADPYINIAYPDAATFYWAAVFTIPQGAKLHLEGQVPAFALHVVHQLRRGGRADRVGGRLPDQAQGRFGQPVPPRCRPHAPQRDYRLEVVDRRADPNQPIGMNLTGQTRDKLNTPRYGTAPGQQAVLYRIYATDKGTDETGRRRPAVPVLTMPDGKVLRAPRPARRCARASRCSSTRPRWPCRWTSTTSCSAAAAKIGAEFPGDQSADLVPAARPRGAVRHLHRHAAEGRRAQERGRLLSQSRQPVHPHHPQPQARQGVRGARQGADHAEDVERRRQDGHRRSALLVVLLEPGFRQHPRQRLRARRERAGRPGRLLHGRRQPRRRPSAQRHSRSAASPGCRWPTTAMVPSTTT